MVLDRITNLMICVMIQTVTILLIDILDYFEIYNSKAF